MNEKIQEQNVEVAIEEFTPERAEKVLATTNLKNRPLSLRIVKAYAKDMKDGKWSQTGKTVCFDSNGLLVDGQHRLSAVVLSGTTQSFVTVRALGSDAFAHIDVGYRRNAGQILTAEGVSYGKDMASTGAVLRALESLIRPGKKREVPLLGNPRPLRTDEAVEFVSARPALRHVVSTVRTAHLNEFGSPSKVRGALAYCATFDPELTDEWASLFVDAIGVDGYDHVAWRLREKLRRTKARRQLAGSNDLEAAMLIIEGFVRWLDGNRVKNLKAFRTFVDVAAAVASYRAAEARNEAHSNEETDS